MKNKKPLYNISYYKNRKIDFSKPVFVYRNINKQKDSSPVYSIKQCKKVVAHAKAIMLVKACFIVNEKGRKRVKKTKRKNVHAYVKGVISKEGAMGVDPRTSSLHVQVSYDPYKNNSFITKNFVPEMKVKTAMAVCLNKNGCSAAYIN